MRTTTLLTALSFTTLAFAAPSTSFNKRQELSGDDVKNVIGKWKTDLDAINTLLNIAAEQGSFDDADFRNRLGILAGSPEMKQIVDDETTQYLTLIQLFPQEDDNAKALAKQLLPTSQQIFLDTIKNEKDKNVFESNIEGAIKIFREARCCGVVPFLKNYWKSSLEAKGLGLGDVGVSDTDTLGPNSCPAIEECPATT